MSDSSDQIKQHYDVIVVGGGFCGCWALDRLRKLNFNVRLFEAGAGLGGIWYWNCYPGARVDAEVPSYQLTDNETWETWEWKQRFPDQPELVNYFKHVDKVWNLSKDVSYNSRITSLEWDANASHWQFTINNDPKIRTSQFIYLATGFASKRYIPDIPGIDTFKGILHHTAVWPQTAINIKNKRVAVIGTGASGIQVIQEIAKEASHLTVYQRTPNTALPMVNSLVDSERTTHLNASFADTKHAIETTFGAIGFGFVEQDPYKLSKAEREEIYEKLFHTGGLTFWLGNFMQILFDESLNEECYQFWRKKTLPRIDDPKNQEILAPAHKLHPFGVKRVSLEQNFFEIFNQENVELVSLPETPIECFTETGIKTSAGVTEFDVVILATGFDSITGGITQIPITGVDPELSIKEKWKSGANTHLGMATHGFPNLFFTYGPQAPTAFAAGPSCAAFQGAWIVECLKKMREEGKKSIDATEEAEKVWRELTDGIAEATLFPRAKGWYFGTNIPGKPKQALNFMGGMPMYREKIWESAEKGYEGFVMK